MRVTVMSEKPAVFEASLMQAGKDRIQLGCPHAVPLRSLVKVEGDDCLWMGEVVACRQEALSWVAEVCTEHVLRGVTELARLAGRFIGKENEVAAGSLNLV